MSAVAGSVPGLAARLEAAGMLRRFGDSTVGPLTFRVERGEVVGLLGHNGAGKSTAMRMLAGALAPSAGAARVTSTRGTSDATTIEARRAVGWLPETPPLTEALTVEEQLRFVAGLRGLPDARAAVEAALVACDLLALRRTLIGTLSKGTKQRVGVAQAILGDPPALLLDEPTAGMDPGQAAQLRALVRARAPTTAILLSTHLLHEVTALCSRVVLLRRGTVVLDSTLDALRARGPSLEASVLALLDVDRSDGAAAPGGPA